MAMALTYTEDTQTGSKWPSIRDNKQEKEQRWMIKRDCFLVAINELSNPSFSHQLLLKVLAEHNDMLCRSPWGNSCCYDQSQWNSFLHKLLLFVFCLHCWTYFVFHVEEQPRFILLFHYYFKLYCCILLYLIVLYFPGCDIYVWLFGEVVPSQI